ncbi:hypothetical protein EXN66_Car017356 [Scomber scombrus]|uniref:Uncharacterized protein n=1 Tax=Scomber scombrus TaxID=13677 RepID=A0AAV1PN67_SCOSC
MATTEQKQNSKDNAEDFQLPADLMNDLSKHAASFINLYNNSEPRMRQIVEELKEITAKIKKKQRKVKKGKNAGFVTAGVVAALGLVISPFTAGFSLVMTGVAGAACLGLTAEPRSRKAVKKVQNLVDDLLQIVAPLKSELEEINNLCENLQKDAARSDVEHIIRLETHLGKLLDVVAHLKTSVTTNCLIHKAHQCQEAVDGCENMKTQLEDFRESTDTN